MNRKQKIIVSITGIFIVLLALVGLTYAYFLTRITGNENDKSISVTTANLELVYGDGTTTILEPDTKLIPSSTEVGTKDFTVTNNGEDTSYTVLIEDTESYYATNGSYKNDDGETVTYTANEPTEFVSNDFRYTLTCTITSTDETRNGKSCDGVSEQKTFPINGGVITSNNIVKGDVHTYELKFWYIDTGLDQSLDMNKSYQAKVNIVDIRENNPYAVGEESIYEKSLAYNIINNALLKTNGTELMNKPLTKGSNGIYKFVKSPDPTYFNEEKDVVHAPVGESLYIIYGDDYTFIEDIEGFGGEFTLINKDGTPLKVVKYTGTSMAETLKGKYANFVYAEEEPNYNTLTTIYSNIYKISTSVSDFSDETIKVSNIDYPYLLNEEKVLSTAQDNLGTSYYYRGGVQDNYVLFNNMCWRIVRIEGDGSLKLTLAGEVSEGATDCNGVTSALINNGASVTYGYKEITGLDGNTWYIADYENDGKTATNTTGNTSTSLKEALDAWFESKFKSDGELTAAGNKIKEDEWCLGGKYEYKYHTNTRVLLDALGLQTMYDENSLYNWNYTTINKGLGDLICDETKDSVTSRVGSMTADEVFLAGGGNGGPAPLNYLDENASYNYPYWTLSVGSFIGNEDRAFVVDLNNGLNGLYDGFGQVSGSMSSYGVRPSVTLVPNTQITKGTGTKGDPYIIDIS